MCLLSKPPCKNGATCSNINNGYICHCTDYWTGPDCNQGMLMSICYKSHHVRMEPHVLTLTMATSVIVLITGLVQIVIKVC